MGTWSVWHWLVVLVIVMLVFGTKKLRNVGQDLGGAIKGFKEGMKEGIDTAKQIEDEVRSTATEVTHQELGKTKETLQKSA